jgi:hypothetical protein
LKSLFATAAALAGLALVVAGCGGGDSTTDTTASLSKAEFIKQADSICAATEKRGEAEIEEFLKEEGIEGEEPSEDVKEQLAEEIALPTISRQLQEIRALGFPEGSDGEEAEEVIEAAEEDVEAGEEEPSVLFSGEAFKETNQMAKAYGFTTCAQE